MSPDELRSRVSQYEWFHSIDLGHGIVTPGSKSAELLSAEATAIFAPLDLRGRSVIDLGAADGYFTAQAQRRGASHVLAADFPAWADPRRRGKETFELAMSALGVEAESRVLDIREMSVDKIGRWDVVLCLGVLNDLLNPIDVVHKLAAITKEVLVVEVELDAQELTQPAMVFYPERKGWGPNAAGLEGLLRVAAFREVRFTPHPTLKTRGIFHANF